MATMTVGIGDRTATQTRKGHFAHAESGVIAPGQSAKRAIIEKHAHGTRMKNGTKELRKSGRAM
jgi:hypothetical protein